MTHQPFRTKSGGRIDRSRPLTFTFNGKSYQGYQGDTLASALLANGIRLIGRSFKYHRPRGILGSGFEDANGLVQLETGASTEPNLQATRIELYDGLSARSQNCWPSVRFDINEINMAFNRLIPAGFYYKTFMWPKKLWMTYEHIIRNAAGMGESPVENDPDTYAHRYQHCDVLIAGGGPAGIAAALAAGRSGTRVILTNAEPDFGGLLLGQTAEIDGKPALEWLKNAITELESMDDVTLLPRTTVASYYDHNMLILTEHVTDHRPPASDHLPRQRLWQVRAKEVVLATGALERPLVFANNDRPGVMLTSAVQTYACRYGVLAGKRAVVFTNNNSAYAAAIELKRAGTVIESIVDARETVPQKLLTSMKDEGVKVLKGHAVVNVIGRNAVRGVLVSKLNESTGQLVGTVQKLNCDLLSMSGGWTPSVHLLSQSKGKLRFDEELSAFVPNDSFQNERSAGACNGDLELIDCIKNGFDGGLDAAQCAGFDGHIADSLACTQEEELSLKPLWSVPHSANEHGKRFVDFQNDVTAEDIALAHRENYISVEHLKRYTTLGMGTDQGRTSNVNGLAIMAALRGEEISAVGTTTFRPPFSPITMGTIAGMETGEHFIPIRRSAMHELHAKIGATFTRAGQWLRPQYYQRPDESMWQAIWRETKHVRQHVGIVDVSTLGKIDLQGKDATEFLNRLYINGFSKLPVGKCRYGVMLREDGMAFDDGTVTRIADNHYLITTTTAHAGPVLQHMEYMADVEWPDLDLSMISVTEEWAAIAIAGPDSRAVLAKIIDDIDLSNEACPFMAYREGTLDGVPVRLFRISFSGELAYEINVPADYGNDIWQRMTKAGAEYDIAPYGLEAMAILRIEKGHVVGGELNGRTTADDLGFGRMMSTAKDFVGKRATDRPGLNDPDRAHLVGLVPLDGISKIPRGARIIDNPDHQTPIPIQGEVTSNCYSPNLKKPIGLALVQNGRGRIGEKTYAVSPLTDQSVPVRITDPVFIDPDGERLHG
jgi:sarcosine oxidase subunit alpha